MKMYQVMEMGKGIRETYMMLFTVEELTAFLKSKMEMNGYIPGFGGDKTYSINAWYVGEEGQYVVDLEKIWSRYSIKR